MARGIVKFFSTQKGYGFIMPEGKVGTAAPDVYVHISDVERLGLTTLSADQLVEYDLLEDRSGRHRAQNLKLLAVHPALDARALYRCSDRPGRREAAGCHNS